MADSTTVFAAKDESFSATVNRLQQSLGKFEGTLSGFNERAANLGKTFAGLGGKLVALGAAFLGIRSAAQAFSAAIEMGGRLNDLSARTGETAGNLAVLQRAFQNAGAGADSVGPVINRLQRAIVEAAGGAKQQSEAFAKLGLNLEEVKSKTPTEQLQAVAKALQGIDNDSERAAIAMQLLGRSGGELVPLLRAMDIELDTARKQLGSLPAIIDKTNKQLDTIGDNFKAIGDKGKEFFVGLLVELAPALADLTTRLANIDAAGFGAKLSEYAASTARWFTETFKLTDALNNIEVAIKGITAGNFAEGMRLAFLTARDTVLNAINTIVAAAKAAVVSVGEFLSTAFGSESGAVRMLLRAFDLVAANFRKAMLHGIADILALIPGIGESASRAMRGLASDAYREAEVAKGALKDAATMARIDFAKAGRAFPDSFQAAYKKGIKNPLIEMRDRTQETAEAAKILEARTRAAAFNAKQFADNMAEARINMLSGADFSPFGKQDAPETVRDSSGRFPWQGKGDNEIVIDSTGSKSLVGGGNTIIFGGPLNRPRPEIDPLTGGRIGAMGDRYNDRIASLEDRGFFGTAGRLRERRDRRMQEREDRSAAGDFAADRFGGNNMGESFRNFLEDIAEQGQFSEGITREEFEKWASEQAKAEDERKAEQSQMPSAGGDKEDKSGGILETIQSTLEQFKSSMEERLPQPVLDT